MSEEDQQHQQHQQQPPAPAPPSATSGTGMDPNVAGLLCYLFGWVSGLIFYLIEKDDKTIRFHALQSILFGIAAFVIYFGLSIISVMLAFVPGLSLLVVLLWPIVGLGFLAIWIIGSDCFVLGRSGFRSAFSNQIAKPTPYVCGT